MAKSEHDLPKLTAEQVLAHERFAWMEITVEELQGVCGGAIEFDFGQTERRFSGHFVLPEPGGILHYQAAHRKCAQPETVRHRW